MPSAQPAGTPALPVESSGKDALVTAVWKTALQAEDPNPRPIREVRFLGIKSHVTNDPLKILLIPDQMIVVLPLPERPDAPEEPVSLAGGIGFPAVHDSGEAVISKRTEDRMDVVRHDAPGEQAVASALEMEQGSAHDPGNLRTGQPAGSGPRIEVGFGLLVNDVLQTLLLCRAKGTLALEDGFAFRSPSSEDRPGQRVGKVEGNEIGGAFGLPVGQAAAVSDGDLAEAGRSDA
jgi:hypothetical protein